MAIYRDVTNNLKCYPIGHFCILDIEVELVATEANVGSLSKCK